jgi:uncharacterized membrane protein
MIGKQTKRLVGSGVIALILLVAAVSSQAFALGKFEKVKEQNGAITVPLAKLTDGKVHYYKLAEAGKEIAFFAVKAADGSYKTAFDACDACYKAKKGYEQQGDKLNCKNCNQKFAIQRLGPNATGGCNPGYLPHQLSGDTLSIKTSDLREGAKYF